MLTPPKTEAATTEMNMGGPPTSKIISTALKNTSNITLKFWEILSADEKRGMLLTRMKIEKSVNEIKDVHKM